MKYYFYEESKGLQTYTVGVLKYLASINNHIIVDNVKDCDIILISLNDIFSIYALEKLRIENLNKTIVAGGHAAVHFKLLSIFANYVWIGHGFDFFKLNSLDEIKQSKHVYCKDKDREVIESNQNIEWNNVPIIKQSNKSVYYWSGVGCKNKCHFCLTSWTNKHNNNKNINIIKACNIANNKKYNINLVSNEYSDNYNIKVKSHVKDMMISDVDKLKVKDVNMIRCGVEFAEESNRKKYGKYFTNEQFNNFIYKAHELKIELNAFCITGIDSIEQWKEFFLQLPIIDKLTPRVIFKFTTLEILQHTPLYNKRFELFPFIFNNYISKNDIDIIHRNILGMNSMKYRTIPPAHINYMMYRVMLSLCTNIKEFNKVKQCKDYRRQNTNKMYLDTLKMFEIDYQNELKINLR
jgi:hypothetical protein